MEFLLLGPLVVRDDEGHELPLRRRQQRALLSILLLFANEVVSRERLIDALWSERPPPTATTALQGHVSQLRKLLGSERLLTEGSGYRLRPRAGEVDLVRFESLQAEARGLGEPAARAERLRAALSLWHGKPLAEFESEPFARAEVSRLAELRLVAVEERIEAELELGAAVELVPELESLVAAEPYRERLRAQLMLALYRSGRQVESLAVYRVGRALLVDELGIEPSPRLRELEQAILRQDPALDASASAHPAPPLAAVTEPPPPAAEPAREVRKMVTVLFSDLVDFTRLGRDLDPEALQYVISTYFAEMAAVLGRHGGTVEKYIGDAIMAVFGIPVLHEDDALRAVRAADEMRHALHALNDKLDRAQGVRLEARAGIATGEVLAGDASVGQPFATGSAVVVAKRLEEGAGAGDILVDESTYQLVRDAVRAEPAGELDSRTTGKAQSALRIVEVTAADRGRARRLDAPLVGRERQLAVLRTSFANAVTDRTCHLFTILGVAGVGKSRLVQEFSSGLGDGATVLRGRCLPYGEGITYWPLAEVVREAAGVDAESEEQALTMIAAQLAGDENAGQIAACVGEVLGLGGPTAGTSEETFWAVRKLFEGVARRRPLVVVLDDLQWAEPTFIELVEHIADFSRDAPILLLCMGRPELIDGNTRWGGGKLNASSFLLEPLDAGESHQLISNLLDGPVEPDIAERIVEVSEGNPLFTEELLAMLVEDGLLEWRAGSWAASAELTEMPVPASIHSLLAARLERLPEEERTLIERAAVEGVVFHRGSVSELCPETLRPSLEHSLMALVRKDVIRPERADFPGEHAFRFRHGLIRDAAYRSLPKKTRAALHERFADWLERMGGVRPREFEEIVGYHLEQAYRYHGNLHTEDRGDLANRAAHRLESAGRRAISRMDLSAAESLLERAAPLLLRDDSRRAALHAALGGVLIDAGKLDKAAAVLAEATRAATAAADPCAEAHVLVQQAFLELQRPAVDGTEEAARVVERVVPIFERCHDERGRCNARRLEAWVYHHRGRGEAAAEAWEQAAQHARKSGDDHQRAEILTWVASAMFYGPTRVPEGIRRCEQIRAEVSGDRACEAATLRHLAALHAMDGQFELARELLGTAHATFAELGLSLHSAVAYSEATVEMLAGRPDAAEALLRPGYKALNDMGEKAILSTVAAVLARVLLEQERDREAEQFTELADELAASGDLLTHMVWRGVRARILAKRGQMEAAETFAREAVAIAAQTDFLNDRAAALLDLGEVLATAERLDEARTTVAEAVALYELKGNVVSTRAVRLWLPKHTAV